jgi:hypothetical protein
MGGQVKNVFEKTSVFKPKLKICVCVVFSAKIPKTTLQGSKIACGALKISSIGRSSGQEFPDSRPQYEEFNW